MEHRLTRTYQERPTRGTRILYWMQASVRIRDNLALAWAQRQAMDRDLPLEVLFCLDPGYPGANARSFAHLLDGLEDVSRQLEALGLHLTVAMGPASAAVPAAGAKAALVVYDRAYFPWSRKLRADIARQLPCPVVMAEDNVSVPAQTVTDKEEWAAATLRPKLMRLASLEQALPRVLEGASTTRFGDLAADLDQAGVRILKQIPDRQLLADLEVDRKVEPTTLQGGETAAWARWTDFRDQRLDRYDADRTDPNLDGTSGLSPALHFGHISPLGIITDLKNRGLWKEPTTFRKTAEDPVSKFLDELLVRRELAFNYVLFNPHHATFLGVSPWARKTLEAHKNDPKPVVYDRAAWEQGRTHDQVWNAAQFQLASTGILPGHMRMYWGKKILEWGTDPAQAYADALYLNDKYALDGRDPNSCAGVAWCFGKHDRPWVERANFGMVRAMTSGGLARKFDLAAYVRKFTPPT